MRANAYLQVNQKEGESERKRETESERDKERMIKRESKQERERVKVSIFSFYIGSWIDLCTLSLCCYPAILSNLILFLFYWVVYCRLKIQECTNQEILHFRLSTQGHGRCVSAVNRQTHKLVIMVKNMEISDCTEHHCITHNKNGNVSVPKAKQGTQFCLRALLLLA